MLQEFAVGSEVIIISHPEVVRKLHAWLTGSPWVLRRFALMTDKLDYKYT